MYDKQSYGLRGQVWTLKTGLPPSSPLFNIPTCYG